MAFRLQTVQAPGIGRGFQVGEPEDTAAIQVLPHVCTLNTRAHITPWQDAIPCLTWKLSRESSKHRGMSEAERALVGSAMARLSLQRAQSVAGPSR